MKWASGLFILVALCFQTGCAQSGARSGLMGELPIINSNEFAKLIIVWPEQAGGIGLQTIIFDGKQIVGLDKGEYTIIKVPTGEHTLGIECCPKFDIILNCEAGNSYYYLVKYGAIRYALIPTTRHNILPSLNRSKYLQVDNDVNAGN